MDLHHTLLRHALVSASLVYQDMLEAERNDVERRELCDELVMGEEAVRKDKSLAEEKVALQDDAQSDILYSIWLRYLDLNLRFLGPAVGELIKNFEEMQAAGAIEIFEGDHGVQDEND
ncbi:hypothetical protein ACOSP7_019155 [Xanthoceras sorbifolium]